MSGRDGNRLKPFIDGTEWVPLLPTDTSPYEQVLTSTISAYGSSAIARVDVANYASVQDALTAAAALIGSVDVYIPAGNYTISGAASITTAADQSITIRGAGQGVTVLNATDAGGLVVALGAASGATISDMTIVNSSSSTTGGIGLSVTSATANNGPLVLTNVGIGAQSLVHGFSTNLNLSNVSENTIANCQFQFPTADTSGTHIKIDGNATFPSINTKISDCFFNKGAIGLLLGNGTDSYVQGVNMVNSIMVGTVSGIKWHKGAGYLADALQISNSQINYSTGTGVDIDTVLHVQLVGNYIFGSASTTQVSISNPEDSIIAGNFFFANGLASVKGIDLSGANLNGAPVIVGNSFFGFNASGDMPITIGASVQKVTVASNAFPTSSFFVTDNGTNNLTSSAQTGNAWIWDNASTFKGLVSAQLGANVSGGALNVQGGTPGAGNNIALTGHVAGGAPTIQAFGADADIDLAISAKGAGSVTIPTATLTVNNTTAASTAFVRQATCRS